MDERRHPAPVPRVGPNGFLVWSSGSSWRKGDTSGDRQFVRAAHYDCDGDTLLFVVEQEGAGACHTGARSCVHSSFKPDEVAQPGNQ